MKHMLAYQAFGHRTAVMNLLCPPNLPIVRAVEILQDGSVVKQPCRPYRDHRKANRQGTRGIIEHYLIEQGKVYEVWEPISWRRGRHYYAIHDGSGLIELTLEEVRRYVRP